MLSFLQNWLPVNGAEHGPQIDQMIGLIHWLMLGLFVGWSLYFVYVLVRFRAGRNPEASYTGAKSHFSSYIEAGVAVFEAVLLVGFAIPAWAAWVEPPDEAVEEELLRVRVVAEQFAWNVHYPGPDGVFGSTDPERITGTNPLGLDRTDEFSRDDVVSTNQLHLPVDRPVQILLSTKDVIHSFALTQMRVKQDAIPGLQVPIDFKPVMTTPPEARLPECNAEKACWEIACAQLCGLGHFRMRGYYTVHPQEEFDAWMAEQVTALPSMQQPAPAEEVPGEGDTEGQGGESVGDEAPTAEDPGGQDEDPGVEHR